MQDITKFTAKDKIKPELSMVYVHKKDGNKYAVATDAFRLVEIKLDDFLNEMIELGYYSVDNWKKMCKSYNKKNRDLQTFSNLMKANNAIFGDKDWNYPEYSNIFPKEDELVIWKSVKTGNLFNKKYFIEFIEMIPEKSFGTLDFNNILLKQEKEMLYYKSDNIKLLLMACKD